MTQLYINLGTQELIILLVFSLIPLFLPIYSIIDLLKRDFSQNRNMKLILILLILFAPLIGSLVYLLGIRSDYPLKNR